MLGIVMIESILGADGLWIGYNNEVRATSFVAFAHAMIVIIVKTREERAVVDFEATLKLDVQRQVDRGENPSVGHTRRLIALTPLTTAMETATMMSQRLVVFEADVPVVSVGFIAVREPGSLHF